MIAREGRHTIFFVTLLLLISGFLWRMFQLDSFGLIFLILILALVFCLQFFRDPKREIPIGNKLVLSPADGKVVDISETDSGERKVSVFLSIFDVHRNRVPVKGKVTRLTYSKGRFLAAFKPEASEINEYNDVEIQSESGIVRVRQIAGVLARRIICSLHVGQEVLGGESLGFIRFGSRTELVLPPGTQIFVGLNDRLKGGLSVIGKLR